MREVHNEVFYHIHTPSNAYSHLWKPDTTLTFGLSVNQQCKKTVFEYNRAYRNFSKNLPALNSLFDDHMKIDIPFEAITSENLMYEIIGRQEFIEGTINQLNIINNSYKFLLKEAILDMVRKESYPDLPPRDNCLYVTTAHMLPCWNNILNSGKSYKIFAIELSGTLFCADGELIDM